MNRNLIVVKRFCTCPSNPVFLKDQLFQKLLKYNKHKTLPNFPLNFSQPCKTPFMMLLSKQLISNTLLEKYKVLMEFLQNPVEWRKRNYKQGHNIHFEPTLQNKLFQMVTKNQINIKIIKSEPFEVKQVARDIFSGVFIHRKLNMSRKCYSFEHQPNKNRFKFGLREKMTRQSDIKQITDRAHLFDHDYFYQNIYKTASYRQFAQKQQIYRVIFRVQTDLQIKFSKIDNKTEKRKYMNYQIGYESPSVHYLQVQFIKIPYRQQEMFLTDVDFILAGNPYFSK